LDENEMRRFVIGWLLLLPLAACQSFQTVSEDDTHVTYRFDPAEVSDQRVIDAARDKCSMSPLGIRRAVPEDISESDGMRQIAFVCAGPPSPVNAGPMLDKALGTVQQDVDKAVP
jgi:hypothetical protein